MHISDWIWTVLLRIRTNDDARDHRSGGTTSIVERVDTILCGDEEREG